MKKLISLLLCIVLISGCGKQLNKTQPEPDKTDNKNANRPAQSPSPSPSSSPLPTPRPTSTPRPASTPEPHKDVRFAEKNAQFSDDEAAVEFDVYLSGVFQKKNIKPIAVFMVSLVAAVIALVKFYKEPVGFYFSSIKPKPQPPNLQLAATLTCWQSLKNIVHKAIYPVVVVGAPAGLCYGVRNIDTTQDEEEEKK